MIPFLILICTYLAIGFIVGFFMMKADWVSPIEAAVITMAWPALIMLAPLAFVLWLLTWIFERIS